MKKDNALLHSVTVVNTLTYAHDLRLKLQFPRAGARLNILRYGTCLHTCVHDRRWHTLISHAFVHGGFLHLGLNTIGLYSAAPILIHAMGPLPWLGLHLSSAVFAGSSALLFNTWQACRPARKGWEAGILKQRQDALIRRPMVGMSGCVFAQFAAVAVLLGDNARYQMIFLPASWGTMSREQFFGGFTLLSVALAVRYKPSVVAHAAHLGGLFYGWAFTTLLSHPL